MCGTDFITVMKTASVMSDWRPLHRKHIHVVGAALKSLK